MRWLKHNKMISIQGVHDYWYKRISIITLPNILVLLLRRPNPQNDEMPTLQNRFHSIILLNKHQPNTKLSVTVLL